MVSRPLLSFLRHYYPSKGRLFKWISIRLTFYYPALATLRSTLVVALHLTGSLYYRNTLMKLLRLAAVQSELQGNSAALHCCIVKALLINFLRSCKMNNCRSFINFLVICNSLRDSNCSALNYNEACLCEWFAYHIYNNNE